MKKCKRISTIISGRWLSFFAVTVLALALIIPTAAKSATALDLEASVDAETTVVEITVAQPLEEYVWVKYIVQPGDYIQKIAIQEYGVTAMWRDIWDWNKEVIGDDPNRLTPFVELSLKKEAADVTEKTIKEPEVEPLKKDASVVIAITVDKPEVKPLKKDTVYVVEKAIEAPEVEPLKKDTADVVEKATEAPEVEPLKKDTADVAEKAIEKPEVEPLKKDTADVAEKAIEKPEVEPLKKDTADVAEKATEKPEVKTLKEDIKSYSWKFKLYGSYGMVEPLGVTGQLGWNGNLGGFGATALFDNMYTWEVGLMLHPYGFTGREAQCPNSFGISIDYASFDHVGAVDTTISNFNANDTTATRYAISFVLQQNLTGRKEARPKLAIYFEESLRVGIHSFGSIDGDLYGNNHISGGIGLAQGINFLIFDLKFYETLAYSPDIARITGLSFFESLDFEVGLRLGIALKL